MVAAVALTHLCDQNHKDVPDHLTGPISEADATFENLGSRSQHKVRRITARRADRRDSVAWRGANMSSLNNQVLIVDNNEEESQAESCPEVANRFRQERGRQPVRSIVEISAKRKCACQASVCM